MSATDLRTTTFAVLLTLGLSACGPAENREQDEKYIVASEGQWAAAVASGDSTVVERILADDYRGVAPDGSSTDKAIEVAGIKAEYTHFVSNHVNDIKVRFYGDTAIAQGSESWELKDGEPRHGRYVWTDTWLRRNGQWQIVAAEDLPIPEPAPAAP